LIRIWRAGEILALLFLSRVENIVLYERMVITMTVTLIKFMTKEELIKMMSSIKNFKYNGRCIKPYGHYNEPNWVTRAKHTFKISRVDYVDVLLVGEGYVRYDSRKDSIIYDMLTELYGFVEES
jgi:hypothetical protein